LDVADLGGLELRPERVDGGVERGALEVDDFLDLLLKALALLNDLLGLGGRDGDDAADALGDGLLADDGEAANLARGGNVRATAKLDRAVHPLLGSGVAQELLDRVANRDDADGVGVDLTENGAEAVDRAGLCESGLLGIHGQVLLDLVHDDALDLANLVGRHGLLGAKVEAEAVGGNQRALLVDAVAEDRAKAKVEQVRGRVVALDGIASELYDPHKKKKKGTVKIKYILILFTINNGGDTVAELDRAVLEVADVEDKATIDLDVLDGDLDLVADLDRALVKGLATLFGVKVGLIEDDAKELVGGLGRHALDKGAPRVDGEDLSGPGQVRVLGLVVGGLDALLLQLGNRVNVERDAAGSTLFDSLGGFLGLELGLVVLVVVDLETLFLRVDTVS